MSHYQPPYPQPPYVPPNVIPYYAAPIDPLRPAKRASLMLFIIGPLQLMCGVLVSSMPWLIKSIPPDQSRQLFERVQSMSNVTVEEFFSTIFREGVVITVFGIAFIMLGVFVRRGGRTPAIVASVMTLLVLLSIGIGIVVSLTMLGTAAGVCQLMMQFAFAGLFASLLYLLIQAVRASSTIKAAQQQYQAQYWQYQQNMQAYLMQNQQMPQVQPSMGYATALPPPNASPPNSPPPNSPPALPPVVPPNDPNLPPPAG